MRITHQQLSRNYLSRMNNNLSNLTKSNERMASQRAFMKGYENVSDAGRALKIRRMISDNQRYSETIRESEGRASAAEDSLRTVNSLLTRVTDRAVQGLNGTMSQSDRDKIGIELEKVQEEIMQLMNTNFSGKHIFAAAGNADGSPPFTKDAAGNLLFNGTVVDNVEKDPATGRPSIMNGGVLQEIPFNEKNFVDIGFGFAIGADGRVDPDSGFQDSFSGIESFGYGRNAEGVPLNAHSLVGKMVNDLRTSNISELGKDLNAVSESMDFLLTTITEIGSRGVMLQDTQAILDTEFENLAATQGSLEGIDLSREAIMNKDYEMSWMVTLQLGSKILPQTIFDFIR